MKPDQKLPRQEALGAGVSRQEDLSWNWGLFLCACYTRTILVKNL